MLSPASQPDVNVPSGDGRQPVDRGPADDNDAGQRFGSARDTGRISHCIGNGLPPQPLGGANEFGRELAIARSICPHLKRISVSAQSAKLHTANAGMKWSCVHFAFYASNEQYSAFVFNERRLTIGVALGCLTLVQLRRRHLDPRAIKRLRHWPQQRVPWLKAKQGKSIGTVGGLRRQVHARRRQSTQYEGFGIAPEFAHPQRDFRMA